YAVTGSMTDRARSLIARGKAEVDKRTDEDSTQLRGFKFRETPVADPEASLEHGDIHFYIQTYTGEEADALPDSQDDDNDNNAFTRPQATRFKTVPLIRVVYRGNNDASSSSSRRMESLLRVAKRLDSDSILVEHGFPGDPRKTFDLAKSSLA